jgi:hypothetical protein
MKTKLSSVCLFAALLTFAGCLFAQEVVTFPSKVGMSLTRTIKPGKNLTLKNPFGWISANCKIATKAPNTIPIHVEVTAGKIYINHEKVEQSKDINVKSKDNLLVSATSGAGVKITNNSDTFSVTATCKTKEFMKKESCNNNKK